jgi:hypothetical protein
MSQTGRNVPESAAVIASSHLDLVVTDTPDQLHARFRHLGVWDKIDVQKAARDGQAQALRFINTEIFPRPVPRARLSALAHAHGLSPAMPPPGPRRLPADLFAAIYQEGQAQ